MDHNLRTASFVVISIIICIVEFFFNGWIWEKSIWLAAFGFAIEAFIGDFRYYRRYFRHDTGVAKERYFIRLGILFLFTISIFGLGVVDLLRYGHSIQSLALIFFGLLIYGYIVKKWL